jgi:hypothetical protein
MAVKADYYGIDSFKLNGKTYMHLQSSEESDRVDYSTLIDFTYQWAAENGVAILDEEEA